MNEKELEIKKDNRKQTEKLMQERYSILYICNVYKINITYTNDMYRIYVFNIYIYIYIYINYM